MKEFVMKEKNVVPIEVAAGIIVDQNKVLMAKREGGYLDDLWEFPGGKLEGQENAASAVERELLEELALTVVPEKTLMILEHEYPDKLVRLHFVKCRLAEQCTNFLVDEIDKQKAKWIDYNDFPLSDLCPADRIAAMRICWQKI